MPPPVAFDTACRCKFPVLLWEKVGLLGQRQVLNEHENEEVAKRTPTMVQLQSPVTAEEVENKRGA